MKATRWSGLYDVVAGCADCDWYSDTRNTMPNAKRHAEAHGHTVIARQEIGVTYALPGMDRDEVSEARGRALNQHPTL